MQFSEVPAPPVKELKSTSILNGKLKPATRIAAWKHAEENLTFEEGDHVYSWHDDGVLSFQHHGIITKKGENGNGSIVDFTWLFSDGKIFIRNMHYSSKNVEDSSSTSNGLIKEMSIKEWKRRHGEPKKVQYGVNFRRRIFEWPGTCTSVVSDPIDLVIARVRFLVENSEMISLYRISISNCECFAVWAKTGHYVTLQGLAILSLMIFGKVGGALGFFRVKNQIALVLAMVSFASFTSSLALHYAFHSDFKRMTNNLNNTFWSMADPSAIIPCILQWG